MKSIFEQIGGTYTKQGDYCLPNLYLPPEEFRIKDAVNMGLRKGYMRDNKIKSLMP